MEEDMEYGIPGHASKKAWANRLQQWLRSRGLRFEAEGEATRVSLDSGVYLEVAESLEEPGAYEVIVTLPLPVEPGEASSEEALQAVRDAFELAGGLEARLRYELDNDMPDYPSLRIIAVFRDPEEMVSRIIGSLERLLNR